jgi:hypothetical protein
MPHRLPSPDRRRLLGLLASLPVLGRAGGAIAALSPAGAKPPLSPPLDGATILVPGPDGGPVDRWARLVQPALAQALAPGTAFRQVTLGGADGVTAANQFEARGTQDGLTLLLTPGDAPLAWLTGDPRAKFDVSRWAMVVAGISPAVLVGRPDALSSGRPVRLAAAGPAGPDLPAALGIELLGARAELVSGLAEEDAVQVGFTQNAVDAVLLRGHKVPEQVKALAAIGGAPLFALGVPDEFGHPIRSAAFPGVPTLPELYAKRRGMHATGPLFSAWRAASIAVQLEFALVVPVLTPAPTVALWRRAGVDAMATLDIQTIAASMCVQPVSGPVATACGDVWSPRTPALLALRQWLAERFNWRAA